MILTIAPIDPARTPRLEPDRRSLLPVTDPLDFLKLLPGLDSLTEPNLTQLRLQEIVSKLVPGEWRSYNEGKFLEKEAMNSAQTRIMEHWKEVPGSAIIDFVGSARLVSPYQGNFRCAFMLVGTDANHKQYWLDNKGNPALDDKGTPIGIASDSLVGNLFIIDPDGSGWIATVFSPEAMADFMVQLGNGKITPPEWVSDELSGSLKYFQKQSLGKDLPEDQPVVIHTLQIAPTGLEGVVKSSLGEHDVAFGTDNIGRPCVRVLGSTLRFEAEGNMPNLNSL